MFVENVRDLIDDPLCRFERGAWHHFDFDAAILVVDDRLELGRSYREQEDGQQQREIPNAQHPDTVIEEARTHVLPAIADVLAAEAHDQAYGRKQGQNSEETGGEGGHELKQLD